MRGIATIALIDVEWNSVDLDILQTGGEPVEVGDVFFLVTGINAPEVVATFRVNEVLFPEAVATIETCKIPFHKLVGEEVYRV